MKEVLENTLLFNTLFHLNVPVALPQLLPKALDTPNTSSPK